MYNKLHNYTHTSQYILTHHSNMEIHLTRHYNNVALCVSFLMLQIAPQSKSRNSSYDNSSQRHQLCVVILTRRAQQLDGQSSQGQAC